MKSEVCRVEEISNGFLIHWHEPADRPPTPTTIIDTQVYGTPSFGLRPYLLREKTSFCSTVEELQAQVSAAIKARREATRLQKEGLLEMEDDLSVGRGEKGKVKGKAGGGSSGAST